MEAIHTDPMLLEREVNRVAEALWSPCEVATNVIVDGQERDGIFVTEYVVHCVESTIDTSQRKAEHDLKKLDSLVRILLSRFPEKTAKGWLVTAKEPTPHQQLVAQNFQRNIVLLSLDRFRAKVVDSRKYISARAKYEFGSVWFEDEDGRNVSPKFIQNKITDYYTGSTLFQEGNDPTSLSEIMAWERV
jgi:hypothetical protein